MWSSWVNRNGTTQVMFIAKLKDGQKELRKLSQLFWKGFLKWYNGGGENGITLRRIFEVEVFFSYQNINFPFYLKRLLKLFFFPLFFSFFHAHFLEGLEVLMIFEEKITSSKTSFQMASIYWRWTHISEWSYAR
jgi:hypothetical protein